MPESTETRLITSLKKLIEWNQDKCTKLSTGLLATSDPSWTLGNCDDVFQSAAMIKVANDTIGSLYDAEDKGVSESARIEFLIDRYQHEIMNKARWGQRSASITSNLMDQCRLSALVGIVEILVGHRNNLVKTS
jgi:hypothetical protein